MTAQKALGEDLHNIFHLPLSIQAHQQYQELEQLIQ
uniref:Uncharacterized protein n=1 Tax=Arundo donax TaxID=35708 RepID=A0A0A8Z6L8_ARUDO